MAEERIPVIRPEKRPTRSSRRLLFFLMLFFLIVLIVLFFQSSISRIAGIEVEGNAIVSSDTIEQAAGLQAGDQFFGFRTASVSERIRQAVPAIREAKIVRHFPGRIVVQVQEYPRVAFQTGADGGIEAVLANGFAVPLDKPGAVVDKPLLSGWASDDPWRAKLCAALGKIPENDLSFLSEIRPAPTVSYPDKIKIYTRSQFEVYTTVTYLPDKMKLLYSLIDEMISKKETSGVFELLEVDVYRPFDVYYGNNTEKDSAKDSKTAPSDSNAPAKQPSKPVSQNGAKLDVLPPQAGSAQRNL